MLTLLLSAFLAPMTVALADTTPKRIPPLSISELKFRIRNVLDSTKTRGLGLAIVRHDSILYAGGMGEARLTPTPGVPATYATLFRIGSTSKQFVALTVMALVHEGKLSLDDKLATRLPGLTFRNRWEATDPVRIIHLLEHTSGFDDNSLRSYASSDPTPITLEKGLTLDSLSRESRWRPGTRFSYCNPGPAIVARIIELIEGKPFEQVVQERWFTPIGMRTATYFFPDSTTTQRATLYRDDGETPVPYWHVFARPAGSINAAATDMAAYLRFVLGRGTVDGRVLLPATDFATLEHSQSSLGARAGLTLGYGKHLYQTTDSTGFIWTGHNGGVEGGLSDFSYIPESGIGYAVQINSGNGDALQTIGQLVRAFLTRGLTPPPAPPQGRVPASVQSRYAGWYREVNPRQEHLRMLTYLVSLQRLSFTDTSLRVSPALGDATTLLAVDSLRFRTAGAGAATMALVPAAMNDNIDGAETVRGESLHRVPTGLALLQLTLAGLWMAVVSLSLLAMLFGAARWLVRRVRKRPSQGIAPAAMLWRWTAACTALLLGNLVAVSIGSGDVTALGSYTLLSASVWTLGILFAVAAVVGAIVALGRRSATTRWQRVSLLAARAGLLLQAVAAGYLITFSYIGWKTWV